MQPSRQDERWERDSQSNQAASVFDRFQSPEDIRNRSAFNRLSDMKRGGSSNGRHPGQDWA
jgi:hypothetical protein